MSPHRELDLYSIVAVVVKQLLNDQDKLPMTRGSFDQVEQNIEVLGMYKWVRVEFEERYFSGDSYMRVTTDLASILYP